MTKTIALCTPTRWPRHCDAEGAVWLVAHRYLFGAEVTEITDAEGVRTLRARGVTIDEVRRLRPTDRLTYEECGCGEDADHADPLERLDCMQWAGIP